MSDPNPPATPPKQRLQDRLWSFRAVIAVALASVILGGLGGAVLANVADDDDGGRFGPGPGQGRFGPGGPMRGPGMMDDRQRERWNEWRREQRQWGQDNPPGLPPSTQPSPSPSTSPSPQPSSSSPTPTR